MHLLDKRLLAFCWSALAGRVSQHLSMEANVVKLFDGWKGTVPKCVGCV